MKIVKKQSRSGFIKIGMGILFVAALILFFLLAIQPSFSLFLDQSPVFRSLLFNSTNESLPSLIIDMPFEEYNRILSQREEALSDGVVIASNNDFVQADIRYQGETIPVELRLQQGPANHLAEEEKWNFDGRTRSGRLISGMQRFYLIDPADNNWLNEAAFAEALRMEELIAGQYLFVQLYLNGEDKGIYALQEGFGQEIINGNGRSQGVIVEFDSTPLWNSIAHFGGDQNAVLQDPISNLSAGEFQYFQVDTFRDAAISDSQELTEQKNRAISLLRGLQSGDLSAGEVFDIELYGRFLALADLWGAIDATSLVNLRYYYNPESDRLEPVGFNGNPLSSHQRIELEMTYGDFMLQEAIIDELQRMATEEYLDQLSKQIGPAIQDVYEALSSEVDVSMPWSGLEERQEEIRRSLSPLQPILAYLGSPALAQEGIIQIDIANALNVPVQIMGFNIDGATFLALKPDWIQNNFDTIYVDVDDNVFLKAPIENEKHLVRYIRVHIPLSEIISQDSELDFMSELDIQVASQIAGLDDVRMVSAQPGYPEPVLIPPDPFADE